jgi:hypothetical protein
VASARAENVRRGIAKNDTMALEDTGKAAHRLPMQQIALRHASAGGRIIREVIRYMAGLSKHATANFR